MTHDTLIIGGGLAGLATATALATHGVPSTILEARPRLGGRASSFTDAATGQLLDACQHVSMGCCVNLAHLFATLGLGHLLAPQPALWFMTPDGRVSPFKRDPWPAPFHLGRALAGAHYLNSTEKARIAWGLLRLRLCGESEDPPLLPWLQRHWQTPRTIERFWSIVLTSALNERIDRIGLKYARKVFVDGFMAHRDGYVVQVPSVPLGALYGDELKAWCCTHGVTIETGVAVKGMEPIDGGFHVTVRDGDVRKARRVVLAVPFDRVLGLLPPAMAAMPFFARIASLQPSPITSVHCWFDREIMNTPHVVLVDCHGQWVFRRDGGYVQVVVSAARESKAMGHVRVEQAIVEELRAIFPAARDAKLERVKVVTEHTATFSAVPGVDDFRPEQLTPVPGLYLAGDWTATGWPATMEGAVRSGYLAAEGMLPGLRCMQSELAG